MAQTLTVMSLPLSKVYSVAIPQLDQSRSLGKHVIRFCQMLRVTSLAGVRFGEALEHELDSLWRQSSMANGLC